MADFSHLDGQIAEAANTINEGAREVTQTREQRILNRLGDYESPALVQTVRQLLSDEKYMQLENIALEARNKAAPATAIHTDPRAQYTPQEAQLLRDENDLRADWGTKESISKDSRNAYIYEVAGKNGIGPEVADRLIEAINATLPPIPRENQQERLANRGVSRG